MRSRTRRLKSACLVMLVSGAAPCDPPATGEAGAVDDHASPVREVILPLPPDEPGWGELEEVGRGRPPAADTNQSVEVPTSFLRPYGEADWPPSPVSKKFCTRSMSAVVSSIG